MQNANEMMKNSKFAARQARCTSFRFLSFEFIDDCTCTVMLDFMALFEDITVVVVLYRHVVV